MLNTRCFRLLLFLVFFTPGAVFPIDLSIFTGKWGRIESGIGSEKPYSVMNLSLTEDGFGKIIGSYCFVTQYGNKVDCSPEGDMNISGHVMADDPNKAIVNFNSFFGAKNGVAELDVNDDGSITWSMITRPQGGRYYGPSHAVFRKASFEAHARMGERLVVKDKAYLYDEPSSLSQHKAYVIKGDFVKLIEVSANMKFWRIEFETKGRKSIKWIDCRDIDFCAR
jgi:hypothetical protein